MTALRLIDSIAFPCKIVNEDLFDHNLQAGWIFDGASGIGPSVIPGAPSDPFWLVHAMNESLKKFWNHQMPTRDLLQRAIEEVIKQFHAQVQRPAPALVDWPTACLLMARLWQNQLQISTIGDCWFVHQGKADVYDFGGKTGDAAAPVRAELKKLKAAGVAGKDLVNRLMPLEREFRAKANSNGGYVIVDLTTRWIERFTQKTRDISAGDYILIMTDGFYRLIDTFHLYDAAGLIMTARKDGLKVLYDQLREMEQNDENCVSFPRVKVRDDVAAALLTVDA